MVALVMPCTLTLCASPGSSSRAILLVLLTSVALGCSPASRGPVMAHVYMAPESRHIEVDGIATLEVIPDVVDVTVTLTTRGDSPKQAVTALNARRDGLVAGLRTTGLKDDQLRLGRLDVGPVYQPHPNSHLIDGYRASITVVASTESFELVPALMEAAAANEATRMSSSFRSTQMAAMKKRARDVALAAARDKALQIAEQMGVQLGELISVEERSSESTWAGLSNENVFVPAASSEAPLQPGALPLKLSLVVRYGLAGPEPPPKGSEVDSMYQSR